MTHAFASDGPVRGCALALALALALGVPSRAHAGPMQTGVPIKVFVGPQAERVTIVPVEPASTHDFLIRFDGFEGDWNGHVFLHHRTGFGRSEDYTTKGADGWRSVIQRDGTLSARPHGVSVAVTIAYSRDASEQVDAAALVKQFEGEQRQRDAQAKRDAEENR